jgi:DNA-directed RNA polymerase sigma subunit (sigma70/sigma32)
MGIAQDIAHDKRDKEIEGMLNTETELYQQTGKHPTDAQLAAATGLAMERIRANRVRNEQRRSLSLDRSILGDPEAESLGSRVEGPLLIPPPPEPYPQTRRALEAALKTAELSAEQIDLIRAKMGLPPYRREWDEAEIGQELGITAAQVKKDINAAINRLRRSAEAMALLNKWSPKSAANEDGS